MRFCPRGQLARSLGDSWLCKPLRWLKVLKLKGNFCHLPGNSVFLVLSIIRSVEDFLLHVSSSSIGLDPSANFTGEVWILGLLCSHLKSFLVLSSFFPSGGGGQNWESKACNPSLVTVMICCLISIERILSLTSPPALFSHPIPISVLCWWGQRR